MAEQEETSDATWERLVKLLCRNPPDEFLDTAEEIARGTSVDVVITPTEVEGRFRVLIKLGGAMLDMTVTRSKETVK